MENERLKNDNTKLVAAFREKSRKHQQTQELYDRLKRKEMTAATQSAAFDSVDEVLGAVSNTVGIGPLTGSHEIHSVQQAPDYRPFQAFDASLNGAKFHQRRDSNHSQGSGGGMPPPPLRRSLGNETGFSGGKSSVPTLGQCVIPSLLTNPTPSGHRTRLGPLAHSPGGPSAGIRNSVGTANRLTPNETPAQRQHFGNFNTHSASRNSLSGYGMSAGMKVGRQQGKPV